MADSAAARPLRPGLERLAGGVVDRMIPRRASGNRLQAACLAGGVSLRGTGLHPGLMVEQVLLRLAGVLDEVREVRFLEVGDLSATARRHVGWPGEPGIRHAGAPRRPAW
ncbi:hypothetical protein [Nocardia gamkensis]|uniref:Uncharacterized protein n=1 Tax=Nocardia gamkensis TaxID=352869 RepID=A0A7X6R2D6_9NOCA|nr:hypothetical protein [Nocardia gamkensis]NKY26213.1 hypothetical protein [Nocardia gamkensis]